MKMRSAEQRKKNAGIQPLSDESLESVSGGIARGTVDKPVQPAVTEILSRPGTDERPVQPGTGELASVPGKIRPVQPVKTDTE